MRKYRQLKYPIYFVSQIFTGNSDRNTLIKHSLKPHIEARYIRFHPRTHSYKAACLRAELYGCQDGKFKRMRILIITL